MLLFLLFFYIFHWFAIWEEPVRCLFRPSCVGGKGQFWKLLGLRGRSWGSLEVRLSSRVWGDRQLLISFIKKLINPLIKQAMPRALLWPGCHVGCLSSRRGALQRHCYNLQSLWVWSQITLYMKIEINISENEEHVYIFICIYTHLYLCTILT